jgi:deazaflavin-dependent oxidoreductase (nitroreductase family)
MSKETTGNEGVDEVMEHVHAAPEQDWGAMVAEVAGMSAMQTQAAMDAGTTEGILIEGSPIVVVTAQGAKTGKVRKFALMRVEHEGSYALVASIGGAPNNPAWYHNIKANPRVKVQDGSVEREFIAEEVTGEHRSMWWKRAVAAYPSFDTYQARCERVIPVFELTPA